MYMYVGAKPRKRDHLSVYTRPAGGRGAPSPKRGALDLTSLPECFGLCARQVDGHTFSKVLCIVTVYIEYNRALNIQNLYAPGH